MLDQNLLASYLDESLAQLRPGLNPDEIIKQYPAEYRAELSDLLAMAKPLMMEAAEESNHAQRFESFVAALVPNKPNNNFFNSLASFLMKLIPKKLVTIGGAALGVVLILYGIGSFVLGQLVMSTAGDGNGWQTALTPDYTEESVAQVPLRGFSGGGGGLQAQRAMVGNASGLASSDIRVSNPLSAGIRAMDSIFKPDDESYYPPPSYGPAPAMDPREYLRMEYHVRLYTRGVQELSQRAQTIIRGYDGRVDSSYTQEGSANISFVVPKDKFELFKQEVTDLVPAKFITETISSENLLPQKRAIEDRTEQSSGTLSNLQQERATLVSKHNARVKSLNATIAGAYKIIARLDDEARTTTDTVRLAQIQREQTSNYQSLNSARTALSNENAQYTRELAAIDNRIKYTNENLKGLAQQDQNLTDTVETVRGTIRLQWISLRGIFGLYIPGEWQAIIIGLGIIGYLIHRRRQNLETQPVA